MIICPNLYYGISLYGCKKKVRRSLKLRCRKLPLYCIISPANKSNLLEIVSYYELRQPYYRKNRKIIIYGLASTRQEAMYVVEDMVSDAYKEGMLDQIEVFLQTHKQGE